MNKRSMTYEKAFNSPFSESLEEAFALLEGEKWTIQTVGNRYWARIRGPHGRVFAGKGATIIEAINFAKFHRDIYHANWNMEKDERWLKLNPDIIHRSPNSKSP